MARPRAGDYILIRMKQARKRFVKAGLYKQTKVAENPSARIGGGTGMLVSKTARTGSLMKQIVYQLLPRLVAHRIPLQATLLG